MTDDSHEEYNMNTRTDTVTDLSMCCIYIQYILSKHTAIGSRTRHRSKE